MTIIGISVVPVMVFLYNGGKGGIEMKVLMIGGSYFLGRLCTMRFSKKWDCTLVNRGHYSMQAYHVHECFFDRHDIKAWQQLPYEKYDAVIDFCAYQPGDIQTVIEALAGRIQHYVFISTVDVYKRQTGVYKTEDHPLETRQFEGDAGAYITGKVQLEQELIDLAKRHQIPYTILRPGQIYGPFNYAPRESLLIERAVKGLSLFSLHDASLPFQMVYVEDVVDAIEKVVEKKAYDEVYNVVSEEKVTYSTINQILQICQPNLKIEEHSIEEAIQLQYPLPFPFFLEEMEYYNGQKVADQLGLQYTPLKNGLKKTYQAFYPVYSSNEKR